MKSIVLTILILTLSLNGIAQVNGVLEDHHGKKVLTVWGTHYERGYAHGYLLGNEVKTVFENYIINYVCSGSAFIYNTMHSFFVNNYSI